MRCRGLPRQITSSLADHLDALEAYEEPQADDKPLL